MRGPAIAFLTFLLGSGATVEAAAPDWAKPYLRLAAPEGAYIARDDPWVASYSEVEIGIAPGGGLQRSFRQVLAPTGHQARHLIVALNYDGETQRLSEPTVWVHGSFGYKTLKLQKASMDFPDLGSEVLASQRQLLITTEEIEPTFKAILSWQVTDLPSSLDQDLILPFGLYPAAELHLHSAAPVRMVFVEPRPDGSWGVRDGDVTLREVPAYHEVYSGHPWLADPMSALPHVVVFADGNRQSWPRLSAEIAARFRRVLESDASRSWRPLAVQLTADSTTAAEKFGRLASFVQSLSNRELAWGMGAIEPEPPSESLRTMSADCKGKTLLLQALSAEVGIDSVPVLCYRGAHFHDRPSVPTIFAFNHALLAVRLPGAEHWPAALGSGPGKGWVLFDPTDALATVGLPPPELEDSDALWLGDGDGDLFTVHTVQPGCQSAGVSLTMTVKSPEQADFELTIDGQGGSNPTLSAVRLFGETPDQLRRQCQSLLTAVAPGVVVTDARYSPPDHDRHRAPRLEIAGQVPDPLRPVGGGLFTVPSPTAVLGLSLGLPPLGSAANTGAEEAAALPLGWEAEARYHGVSSCLQGQISLVLPPEWTVEAWPELEAISAPWLEAATAIGDPWTVTVTEHRGRFPADSEGRRIQHLKALTGLFRQPFLVTSHALVAGSGP